MRLVLMRFWCFVWSLPMVRVEPLGMDLLAGAGVGPAESELIDFVGQIKASHLPGCRAIGFVHLAGFTTVSETLLQRSPATPVYTVADCESSSVSEIPCAIISSALPNGKNCSTDLFGSSASLIYLINVGDREPPGDIFAADYMARNNKKWLLNSILVVHNSSSHEGYYFDPFRKRLQKLSTPSRTIYPTVSELTDLWGYELHTAFIPDESDRALITAMMETLAIDRNGSFAEPMGFQAASLLKLSRKMHWQFPMFTVGPLAYATCFFVPRAGPVPIGYILVAPFDTGVWIGVLLSAALVVLLLKRFGQASRGSLASAIITLLQSVLTSPNRISRSPFERRILTACSLGCVVLVCGYQSVIFSLISNPAFYQELDTVQQINRSCSLYVLGMDVLGGMDTFRDSFEDVVDFRAGQSCVCTTCRMEAELRRLAHLTKVYRASRHRTHPFPMLISLVDRHYQPLNELVERYVSGFFEAGLTEKLTVQSPPDRPDSRDHFPGRGYPSQQLRMSDLHIVWIVLQIGLASATGCFLAELALKHWKSCKLPSRLWCHEKWRSFMAKRCRKRKRQASL